MGRWHERLRSIGAKGKWLYAVSAGHRLRLAAICLVGLASVACSLAFVWVSKRVVDVAVGAEPGRLWVTALVAVALSAGQIALAAVDTWLSGCLPVSVGNALRRRLFDHLLRTRWQSLDRFHSGDVVNRIARDADSVVSLVTVSLPDFFITLTQFLASFAFLCWLDSSLAWTLVLLIPVFLLLSKLYVRRMRQYNRDIRRTDSDIQAVVQESVQHQLVLKALERVADRLSVLDGLQGTLHGLVKRRTRVSLFSRLMMSSGFHAGYLLVFLWGAFRLSRGFITFGTMSAFMQLVGRVQRPAFDLSSFLPTFVSAYTAVERLMELEALPEEEGGPAVCLEGGVGIRCRQVCFAYEPGGERVFDGWEAAFRPGTATAVLGETGAGKTTLVRLLLGLVTPQQGEVVLCSGGREVPVSARTRANFVYVPQGNTLFSGTIRDNLLLGCPQATEAQLAEALRTAAADFVFDLPDGLDTRLTEQGGGLSEGQAQRVAIARGLLRPGRVLLFDEATSALDPDTEHRLMDNLRRHCQGRTVLFITHHTALAARCDQIIRLT